MRAALALLALIASPALAHDHWINRQNLKDPTTGVLCCDHRDCHEIAHGGVREVVGGGYFVSETNEVIPERRVIWKSEDGLWWLCHWYKDGKKIVRCLIGPPPSN